MSIPGVTAATRVAITVADTPTATTPVQPMGAVAETEADALTQRPAPLRFPWLSRLAQQLEPAAPQKPAFASAPVLGDYVDRAV